MSAASFTQLEHQKTCTHKGSKMAAGGETHEIKRLELLVLDESEHLLTKTRPS